MSNCLILTGLLPDTAAGILADPIVIAGTRHRVAPATRVHVARCGPCLSLGRFQDPIYGQDLCWMLRHDSLTPPADILEYARHQFGLFLTGALVHALDPDLNTYAPMVILRAENEDSGRTLAAAANGQTQVIWSTGQSPLLRFTHARPLPRGTSTRQPGPADQLHATLEDLPHPSKPFLWAVERRIADAAGRPASTDGKADTMHHCTLPWVGAAHNAVAAEARAKGLSTLVRVYSWPDTGSDARPGNLPPLSQKPLSSGPPMRATDAAIGN